MKMHTMTNDELTRFANQIDKELLVDVLENSIENARECQQKYLSVQYPSQKRRFDAYQEDIEKAEKLLKVVNNE